MRKNLSLAFILCFAAATSFSQTGLNGKWSTDRPPDPPTTDAQRKQRVQLEVTIEDAKASGSLNFGGLGGRFYTFKDGRVTGNRIQFRTDPRTETTWTIEMVDDNTVMLYHPPLELVSNNLSILSPVQSAAATGLPLSPATTLAPGGANDSIRGIVQDESKARIPGVTVIATNVDTGAKLAATTNDAGQYSFPSPIPGKYTMSASLSGFRTKTVSDLSVGDTEFLQDFTLELAAPALASPSVTACSQNAIGTCSVLHRAK
jgi:hypothetical protein